MPFTPIHIGPGILIKGILQNSFSLMVFGWTQIVMDIQPLIIMIIGHGHIHGFTHTYLGAILVAIFAVLTGKYLSEIGLKISGVSKQNPINISWRVCFLSAFTGSFSHVFLDSIMHTDVEPFYPVFITNQFFGMISITTLHKICLYSGLAGAAIYYAVLWRTQKAK